MLGAKHMQWTTHIMLSRYLVRPLLSHCKVTFKRRLLHPRLHQYYLWPLPSHRLGQLDVVRKPCLPLPGSCTSHCRSLLALHSLSKPSKTQLTHCVLHTSPEDLGPTLTAFCILRAVSWATHFLSFLFQVMPHPVQLSVLHLLAT